MKTTMKKIWICALCALLAILLVACSAPVDSSPSGGGGSGGGGGGGGGDSSEAAIIAQYGEKISGAEGKALFEEMGALYEDTDAFREMAMEKFSYTLRNTIGETVMTSYLGYSKLDQYMVAKNHSTNIYEYEYDEVMGQFTNTVIGKTFFAHMDNTVYITQDGRMIAAHHNYSSGVDYVPEYRPDISEFGTYEEYDPTEAQERFHETIGVSCMESLSGYLSYVSQMLTSFEPLVEMGNFSTGGLTVEVRSKGANHLYLKYKMDIEGMKTELECVLENGYMSYIKMTVPNVENVPGVEGGYPLNGMMVTEIEFNYNECEIVYPDLSTYRKLN